MLDADRFIRAESVKRAIFIGLTAGVSVLLIADVLRFVPRFDDALSGRPEYLHAVADRMARSLADSTNHQLPALVRQLQEFDCDRTQNVPSRDTDDLLLLLSSAWLAVRHLLEYVPVSKIHGEPYGQDRHDAEVGNHKLCRCGMSVSVSGIRVDAAISDRSASASRTSCKRHDWRK